MIVSNYDSFGVLVVCTLQIYKSLNLAISALKNQFLTTFIFPSNNADFSHVHTHQRTFNLSYERRSIDHSKSIYSALWQRVQNVSPPPLTVRTQNTKQTDC